MNVDLFLSGCLIMSSWLTHLSKHDTGLAHFAGLQIYNLVVILLLAAVQRPWVHRPKRLPEGRVVLYPVHRAVCATALGLIRRKGRKLNSNLQVDV